MPTRWYVIYLGNALCLVYAVHDGQKRFLLRLISLKGIVPNLWALFRSNLANYAILCFFIFPFEREWAFSLLPFHESHTSVCYLENKYLLRLQWPVVYPMQCLGFYLYIWTLNGKYVKACWL